MFFIIQCLYLPSSHLLEQSLQKGRVVRTPLSIQRIINVVMPKPIAVERYWQHSWKCPPCSYICLVFRSGLSQKLEKKPQLTEKLGYSGKTFFCHSLNLYIILRDPRLWGFSREFIIFFLKQIKFIYFNVKTIFSGICCMQWKIHRENTFYPHLLIFCRKEMVLCWPYTDFWTKFTSSQLKKRKYQIPWWKRSFVCGSGPRKNWKNKIGMQYLEGRLLKTLGLLHFFFFRPLKHILGYSCYIRLPPLSLSHSRGGLSLNITKPPANEMIKAAFSTHCGWWPTAQCQCPGSQSQRLSWSQLGKGSSTQKLKPVVCRP